MTLIEHPFVEEAPRDLAHEARHLCEGAPGRVEQAHVRELAALVRQQVDALGSLPPSRETLRRLRRGLLVLRGEE